MKNIKSLLRHNKKPTNHNYKKDHKDVGWLVLVRWGLDDGTVGTVG